MRISIFPHLWGVVCDRLIWLSSAVPTAAPITHHHTQNNRHKKCITKDKPNHCNVSAAVIFNRMGVVARIAGPGSLRKKPRIRCLSSACPLEELRPEPQCTKDRADQRTDQIVRRCSQWERRLLISMPSIEKNRATVSPTIEKHVRAGSPAADNPAIRKASMTSVPAKPPSNTHSNASGKKEMRHLPPRPQTIMKCFFHVEWVPISKYCSVLEMNGIRLRTRF